MAALRLFPHVVFPPLALFLPSFLTLSFFLIFKTFSRELLHKKSSKPTLLSVLSAPPSTSPVSPFAVEKLLSEDPHDEWAVRVTWNGEDHITVPLKSLQQRQIFISFFRYFRLGQKGVAGWWIMALSDPSRQRLASFLPSPKTIFFCSHCPQTSPTSNGAWFFLLFLDIHYFCHRPISLLRC